MNTGKALTHSRTTAIFPVLIALDEFKNYGISGFNGWTPEQKALLELLPAARVVEYNKKQIKSFVSNKVAELNAILKQNCYDIQLDETKNFDLGVVTIMDIMAKWLSKATPEPVMCDDVEYPGMRIKIGASIVKSTATDSEILMLRTDNGICVFIEKTQTERSGFDLFNHSLKLSTTLLHNEEPCDAIIPFVTMDDQPDMTWLLGLQAENTNMFINQALQQNKLKITLDGIHAESATVLGASRGISLGNERPQFIIDGPFNIWMAYGDPELEYFPLFTAYVTPDHWK